jgi:hypothetical protein
MQRLINIQIGFLSTARFNVQSQKLNSIYVSNAILNLTVASQL